MAKRLPRVVIGAASKFWSYHQARGAERAGMLHRLVITIHDKNEVGVPPDKIVQIRWPAYAANLIGRLPFQSSQMWSYYVGDNWFDYAAIPHVRDADIYHVYNHHGLHSMRAAKRAGAITVIERSSAHPTFQHEVLREEYARLGLRYPAAHRQIVAKHIQEYQEADWIVVTSSFIYKTMVEHGVPAAKLWHIPLGFSPERFFPDPQDDGVFRVIFAGALSVQKGLHHLLEGFKLADLPPDRSELVVVGHPHPDAKAFLSHYQGVYRHISFVPNNRLPDILNTGSVFVLPSLQDGYPMVVLEAAACGLPVIVSENVGTDIRHGEDGFIVPIRSPEAIAEKLVYLYTHDAERQRMGRAARQHISQFTWERYQYQLVAHYRDCWS